MEWNSSSNLFEGRGRVSTILITLFLSFFAIAMLYTLYHQLAGVRERLEALDPWYEALDQNEKPILWDAYVEGKKLELEWGRFKPLSIAVSDTLPTRPWTPKRWEEFSKEEEETVHVNTIIVFPLQRKQEPGYVEGAEVEDYAIGTTELRCRGKTFIQ